MTGRRSAPELAQALVQQLYAAGLRDAVLAPGSRSAPLALALHAADRAGDLRLHVRVDERSAAYLALGLATGSRRPVAVVTTSGTAVGNLLPAVMEAAHTGRRLVVVSADRPERLRGTGANQTTYQAGLFGTFATCHDLGPEATDAEVASAVRAACGACGPTQVNVQLDGDLLPPDPDPATWWAAPVGADPAAGRDDSVALDRGGETLPCGPRTVVVAGDDAGPAARLLAEAGGWPLLAEPTSGARIGPQAIRTYRLLLTTPLRDDIERVVVVGRPTLSRPVTDLVSDPALEVLSVRGRDGVATDPGRVARHLDLVPVAEGADDPEWAQRWRVADARLGRLIDRETAGQGVVPLAVATVVADAVAADTTLVVGSSNPVRDLDVMARPWPAHEHRFVVGNRGLAGIDGLVSTAVGVALGRPRAARTLAYVGDLTFLHDSNALLIGPGERRPSLTVVVLNDDGGAIFATLEQGDRRYSGAFERVFGTPHGTDLEALCHAHSTAYERVTDLGRLAAALAEHPDGIRVLEVPVSRADRRAEAARLRELARQALPGRPVTEHN
ncbi:MAG TPA: 2-succinyl-5-enolpyruvyl-6-hydroxy-3-cyclohexene-1-carboxylic-acid synthase [Intrasporangium sp.]|uniref:2-succinyl-5-enolpyruvyl-6-hydroxy-3- cyclohexene-1-carboxylic-acid synthase n=1 Tax=Intrasporangium sp. TaxID=1925024 RepID=UPI002D784F79|nr:2-succinyl-5-enolpyruvyl-6-hydroxy-3-cyclohexene-1-carboxylic-acid synthase [Intrasporangium sp.]HET7398869.1 2-succinyl-5-enolpyruvyl-6-hydroxy-3-cyclohexene-1-carboxylic-acid synthase [Intrasporangium sp.]